MQIGFFILMFVLGACLGSFLCCQVRRFHYRASSHAKKLNRRSICMSCHQQLKWYDNIPLLSWIFLRGKCRYCHKKIGLAELLSELGMALAFLLLSINFNPVFVTPLEWAVFIVTLLLTLTLGFLAIYDGIYGELPTLCLIIAIILALIIAILKTIITASVFSPVLIINPLLSVLILGGLYLLFYLISKGKWVGDGDWLLGISLGLALISPWLALINLFLANFLACLIMYPFVKIKKQHKIHFGPFLVIAFVIVYSFSGFLLGLI